MVATNSVAGPVGLVILAAALLLWPVGGWRRSRLGGVRPAAMSRMVSAAPVVTGTMAVSSVLPGAGVFLVVGATIGWPAGIAAGLVTATVLRLVHRARRSARRHGDRVAVVAALRALVRELDAGSPPPQALDRIRDGVDESAGSGGTAVSQLIDTVAQQGPVPEVDDPVLAAMTVRARVAWAVAGVHGVPLSVLIEALAADLADQLAGSRERAAQTAGPALSGYLLAGMPAVGMLFGLGMGVDPLSVLTGSSTGGILAIAGATLCCAGLLWADRIVRT